MRETPSWERFWTHREARKDRTTGHRCNKPGAGPSKTMQVKHVRIVTETKHKGERNLQRHETTGDELGNHA